LSHFLSNQLMDPLAHLNKLINKLTLIMNIFD
jgi:hypothetical protein